MHYTNAVYIDAFITKEEEGCGTQTVTDKEMTFTYDEVSYTGNLQGL